LGQTYFDPDPNSFYVRALRIRTFLTHLFDRPIKRTLL